ncbi:hypothetical protein LCGC14_2720130 [marine sediment metagenome]|uniref:Uncharacterized protein n=1 Tax=marine sediment metagenome TaxID=412755 RepID=A0A0F8ZAE8_9ZZZZ
MHIGKRATDSDLKHARLMVGRGTLQREDAIWFLARLEYLEVLVDHQAKKCVGYKAAVRGLTRCVNKLKARLFDASEKREEVAV